MPVTPSLYPAASMRQPSRPLRRRRLWLLAAATTIVAVGGPVAGSSADVVRLTTVETDTRAAHLASRLFTPTAPGRDLVSLPESPGYSFTPDPTGKVFVQPVGADLYAVPADGSAARKFSGPRPHPYEVPPTVWWNVDGSALTTGPERTKSGARMVRRCLLVTMRCRLDPIGQRTVAGGFSDGRVLEVSTYGALRSALQGRNADWAPRGTSWVRRYRRLISTPRTNKLWVDGGPGVGRRLLRDLSGKPSTRFTDVSTPGETPAPSVDGQLLAWRNVRLVVQTRKNGGRLQARMRQRVTARGYWLVRPDGQIRSVPKLVAAEAAPIASVPGAGWLGVRPAESPTQKPVRISLAGEVTPLLLNGGRLTPQRLHDALGLPAAQRPPTGAQNPDFRRATVKLEGYEQATGSAVVSYVDPESVTVARLPLDGRSPTLVDRYTGTAAFYVAR